MAPQTGKGEYCYEIVETLPRMLGGANQWNYDIAGIGIDAKNRLYLFNRSDSPIIIVDRDGVFLSIVGATSRLFPTPTPSRWARTTPSG